MDLNSAMIFVKVIQAGSFSKAAAQLQMPVSTVSTKVAGLEGQLGVSLIRRTTRKLSLTDAGERFFGHAFRALGEMQEAQAATLPSQDEVKGVIRMTAPMEMGMSSLSDVLAEFLKLYPEIKIDLELTDRVIDLVGDGFDLAVRAGVLSDSSLMSKRIGMSGFQLFASSVYLKSKGDPKKPQDLSEHNCLRFSLTNSNDIWLLKSTSREQKVKVSGRFSANNLASLRRLALNGVGIALLPPFLCSEDVKQKRLQAVLPEWVSEPSPIHLVYPRQKFIPKRVRVLIDYVALNLKDVF